jgi:hypothetical protein
MAGGATGNLVLALEGVTVESAPELETTFVFFGFVGRGVDRITSVSFRVGTTKGLLRVAAATSLPALEFGLEELSIENTSRINKQSETSPKNALRLILLNTVFPVLRLLFDTFL